MASLVSQVFGKKKPPKQLARESKRIINRSIREIDREMNRGKREKKKAEQETKRLAKQGQMDAVHHLCKDIIRIKNTQQKMIKLKALLRQLTAQLDKDFHLNQNILKQINTCLASLSSTIKLPELQKLLQDNLVEFERMEMKQDMINDAMDDALDVDSDEEDQLVQQVMDEIGLDMNDSLMDAPVRCMMKESEAECDYDLQSRLIALSGDGPISSSYQPSSYRASSSVTSASYSPQRRVHNTIGLSVGGAKDVNNFRECIDKNKMPSSGSITYNGLLYEYYFDTKTRKHDEWKNKHDDEKKQNKPIDDGSKLFYPSYCYAKTKRLDFMESNDKNDDEYEYYMSVGLNSNIKTNEFKRKHLNLCIVLDKSGSMSTKWDGKSKMQVANESVIALLSHLTPLDRFGLVIFDTQAETMQHLQFINDLDLDALKQSILSITQSGGTNFECGYTAAVQLYQSLFNGDEYKLNPSGNDYDHRIIFLTDARPNSGRTDANSLLGMVKVYAENEAPNQTDYDLDEYIRNRIYTTFIGIGVDFNANLIESISKTRGCNYYSVKSTKDFMDKMDDEFEYMVTPLVFNVSLKLNCEGNSCKIEKVYGANNEKAKEILRNGEISRIDTLFPAKRRAPRKGGGTKGGIQLIKLKRLKQDNDNMNVELVVTFEDRNGKKYKNEQIVLFKSPSLKNKNDMIESDEDDGDDQQKENVNFYDNTGIRKGILLCKYVELMKEWIKNTGYGTVKMDDKYKNIFGKMMVHFEKEMIKCKDNDLKKEIDLMKKLVDTNNESVSVSTATSTITTGNRDDNNDDDDADDSLQKRLANLKR